MAPKLGMLSGQECILQLYCYFGVTFHCRFQSSLITSVAVNDRAPYKSARGQVVVMVIEEIAGVNLQTAI